MVQASIPARAAPWRLPDRLVNQGTKLFTQQAWGWGCDVRRPEGNLLLAHGFERYRRPEGVDGSSMYVFQRDAVTQVALWTFGMFYGQAGWGGLYIDRFHFDPRLTGETSLTAAIWRPEGLPPLRRPDAADRSCVAHLLPAAIDWIIDYETTVLTTLGPEYRRACLAGWSRAKLALPPERLALQWQALHAECGKLLLD